MPEETKEYGPASDGADSTPLLPKDPQDSAEIQKALDIARAMAEAGTPIFLAEPAINKDGQWNPDGGVGGTGYWLPTGWQHTKPDPSVLDNWRPGMAVCAVTGRGLDLLDVDPRHDGDVTMGGLIDGGMWPKTYGTADTPSGGIHAFIKSLNVRGRDGVRPGLDVKAGDQNGKGRGFAFIAPTMRKSKVDGELRPYTWIKAVDLTVLAEDGPTDESGDGIKEMVEEAHGTPVNGVSGPTTKGVFDIGGPWDNIAAALKGHRHIGVHKLASALRGRNSGWRVDDALLFMWNVVWPLIDQPAGDPFTPEAFEAPIRDAFACYPSGGDQTGDITSGTPAASDFDAEYLDLADLDNLPQPEPLIAGVINRHSYALISGRDGTMKTFASVDMGLCLATGKPWQGCRTERVKVLYIAGEGAYGLASRIKAWQTGYGQGRVIEPGWFTVRKSAVNLFRGGPELEHLLLRIVMGGYGLVIIDTLRRSSGGADGNGSDMGVVVDNIDRIKRATDNGSVLVQAHTDKGDNDTRGFSGIEDDADIVWHAALAEGDRAVNLTNTKMKDGPDGAVFKLEAVLCGTSLVLQNRSDFTPVENLQDTDGKVMAVMVEMFATTGATSVQLIEATGLGKTTVWRSQARLEKANQILRVRRGTGFVAQLHPDYVDLPPGPATGETGVEQGGTRETATQETLPEIGH